jgi:hypothetical protein
MSLFIVVLRTRKRLTPKEVAAVKGLSLHDCTIVGSFELPFRLV